MAVVKQVMSYNPTSSIVSTLYQAMNVITPSSVGHLKLSNICDQASNATSLATPASMTSPKSINLFMGTLECAKVVEVLCV